MRALAFLQHLCAQNIFLVLIITIDLRNVRGYKTYGMPDDPNSEGKKYECKALAFRSRLFDMASSFRNQDNLFRDIQEAARSLLNFKPKFTGNVPLIVNGYEVGITKFPHVVSIQLRGRHHCGGTIINHDFVLTAAHCMTLPARAFTVLAGSSHLNGTDTHKAMWYRNHPEFIISTYFKDISLLRVSPPFTFSEAKQPTMLPEFGEYPQDSWGTVLGWGAIQEHSASSFNLQAVELPLIGHDECRAVYGDIITDFSICAGFELGGKDACQGDSGGPMFVSRKQVGIVSWGIGCAAEGCPGVYTNIAALRPWIDDVLERADDIEKEIAAKLAEALANI